MGDVIRLPIKREFALSAYVLVGRQIRSGFNAWIIDSADRQRDVHIGNYDEHADALREAQSVAWEHGLRLHDSTLPWNPAA